MTQNRMLVGKLVFALAIGIGVFAGCKKYEGDSTDDSVSAERWRRWRHPQSDSGGTDTTTTPGTTPDPGTNTPATGPTFTFNQLTSDYPRPMAGFEKWMYSWDVNISGIKAADQYFRFSWAGLNPSENGYDWSFFDQQVKSAIDNGYGFSFGIMSCYTDPGGSPGIASFDGGKGSYPAWVHNKMQSESVKDWKSGSDWIPNWNSPSYLAAVEKFNLALAAHLKSTNYKGVVFSNIINSVDIRMFGNWGEWHTYPFTGSQPSGTRATSATLKRIIDSHINAFPDYWLSLMVAALGDGESPAQADISYYLLTAKNNKGEIGIRRDSWGLTDTWANGTLFENNSRTYNGVQLKTLIMNKWKTAPITGEPMNGNNGADMVNQVTKYHINSMGNGNGLNGTANATAANRAMGARIGISSGNASVNGTGSMTININWVNSGNASVYQDWDVIYQLKNAAGNVMWNGKSAFKLKGLLTGSKSFTDQFQLTGVGKGVYSLSIIIKDPVNYRSPYPLSISGRQSDGSYNLNSVTIQ